MKKVYSGFTVNSDRILVMDPASAELVKYASNAMLATRISFMNEIAQVCEKTGGNIHQVRKGMSLDERIGGHFLYAGVGYGGSCFPKDLTALSFLASSLDLRMPQLQGTMATNESSKHRFLTKITDHYQKRDDQSITLAIWGLSFKPGTDDIRSAPSLYIIKHLLEKGYKLRLYDPKANEAMSRLFEEGEQVLYCASEEEAAFGADGICLLTEWKQFRSVDFEAIGEHLKEKTVFDGRNQYVASIMKEMGFNYYGVGLPIDSMEQKQTALA